MTVILSSWNLTCLAGLMVIALTYTVANEFDKKLPSWVMYVLGFLIGSVFAAIWL